jgi:hypothetical protein
VVEKETYMQESHLLCHSDCAGYYLPIDFDDIIVDNKGKNRIAGDILCSSYRHLTFMHANAKYWS